MRFEFSTYNKIEEFNDPDFENKVYLGFASVPEKNIFSQKHKNTKYNSTTQMLRHNLDLLQIPEKEETTLVMHIVQGLVTLDVATAAFAATRPKEELFSRQWIYLAEYVDEIEKGLTRPPFLNSLYAYYYASGGLAAESFPASDQIQERNTYLLETYWETLQAVMDLGKIEGLDSPRHFIELIPDKPPYTLQEEKLKNEVNRFFYHDDSRAEKFELELPLKNPTARTKYSRVDLMAVSDPRTKTLLKFFARNPMTYPDGKERFYSCLYVHNPEKRGKGHEHMISVLPTDDFNLKGLTDLLEEMEDEARRRQNLPERPKDDPRKGGYEYNDPWYDERHTNCSMVDTPRDGSCLEWNDILEALWYFGSPLKTIKPSYVSTSVFIPLWTPESFKRFVTSKPSAWNNIAPHVSALKCFFPFVQNIFSPLEKNSDETPYSTLQSYEYKDDIALTLDPDFGDFENYAIDVVQRKSLEKSIEIVKNSKLKLQFHQYEYGLGFFEIIIDLPEKLCSFFDTQWFEQCISLTSFDKMLRQTLSDWSIKYDGSFGDIEQILMEKLEIPDKHFVCSSLTEFNYEGGYLKEGRSTGGGLQMMVCDENPIFKNLPLDTRIVTDRTVVDITSKRHYFCSSSSLLNFDDVANQNEHIQAHDASRMIFNMVLAQRFILSKSRLDIVTAERRYNENRKLSMLQWIGRGVRLRWKRKINGTSRIKNDDVDISRLRVDIQHMTTSSWFNVISNKSAIQGIFYNIRSAMEIDQFYKEVQDRCVELDEFIKKRESTKQSRIFGFFAFVMSPLSLIAGFTGGLEFNTWDKNPNPLPYDYTGSVWEVLIVYTLAFTGIMLFIWLLHQWWSLKK
ncbi:MAG: hypothetical protein GY866_33530 [Proteobacteria bacterium]|nr:hypothetical protein [Pseudomonadota bacterium]